MEDVRGEGSFSELVTCSSGHGPSVSLNNQDWNHSVIFVRRRELEQRWRKKNRSEELVEKFSVQNCKRQLRRNLGKLRMQKGATFINIWYLIGKHSEKGKLKIITHMQLHVTEISKDGRNFCRECKSRNFASTRLCSFQGTEKCQLFKNRKKYLSTPHLLASQSKPTWPKTASVQAKSSFKDMSITTSFMHCTMPT